MEKEYIPLVQSISGTYRVNPNWVAAIIQKESVWNPWVIRYEKNYPYLFTPEKFVDKIWNSYSTEYEAQKISWGLGQIMGGLAREQGHKGVLPELLKPDVNIEQICIRISKLLKRASDPASIFCMYNGGIGALTRNKEGEFLNQVYVNDVMRNLNYFTL